MINLANQLLGETFLEKLGHMFILVVMEKDEGFMVGSPGFHY